ncbi:MAG: endopeptidase La [Alloprevotella sp.]|nr:endopeptidase La [Alloprevotella sp.]
MDSKDNPNSSFSLIADYEGDIENLLNRDVEGEVPVLPLRNLLLFPAVVTPITIGRVSSLKLIERALKKKQVFAVACQKEAETEHPHLIDLYPIAVAASVLRIIDLPNGNKTAILQTYGRLALKEETATHPYLKATVESLPEILPQNNRDFQVIMDSCKEVAQDYYKAMEPFSSDVLFGINNVKHPVLLLNYLCTNFSIPMEERLSLLQEGDVKERAYSLLHKLNRELQFNQLKQEIQNKTREDLDQQQKEYFLQQQIRNIQHELGEDDNAEIRELESHKDRLLHLPKVLALFSKELDKLRGTMPQSPEYGVLLNWLQTIVRLPWGKTTDDNLDIKRAERILNRDHYGLEKIKERILEHLAVMKLQGQHKAPILCLYGPPGVGKTSLGKSIAEALNRNYIRISLGGVHDESEIRGHRRTYVGAMPGRIIKSLIKAETDNPIFILDEIDKVSSNNYNGDPQSALLEVLDPEQNSAFHDNFLDLDYDLSKVLFIATANSLNTIPSPLLDRMEIIKIDGYLTEEKVQIAKKHLVPKIQKELNLHKNNSAHISAKAFEYIIEKYTRESGVRQLEKQLNKLFRKFAYDLAVGNDNTPLVSGKSIQPKDIETYLGNPPYSRDQYQGNKYAGVVTGLAWTSVGGEILFIETSLSRAKTPKLTITGNLGDVMKESVILALEYVKSHATLLNIDYRIFENWSIHVHVPEGATPKDGPSAGITIASSIASALTQRKVKAHTAMTGEITLRGKVLPVGGIKEKILAAKRAGITEIIISRDNEKDILDINERYIKGLTFHYVENVEEVFSIVLLKEKVDNPIDFSQEQS